MASRLGTGGRNSGNTHRQLLTMFKLEELDEIAMRNFALAVRAGTYGVSSWSAFGEQPIN